MATATVDGGTVPNVTPTTAAPTGNAALVVKGRRFFNTGTGRWSLKGQGWGACQSCHTDGLTDNVTWYFARGPRQSTSLDGTFGKDNMGNPLSPTDQRILNWSAINDELSDFEGNVRGVSGGVGAIVTTDSVNDAGAPAPATSDRIDVTTACTTTCNPTNPTTTACVSCANGNGNNGLNGSGDQASNPSNPLMLTDGQSAADTEWAAVTAYVAQIARPELRRTST